MLATEYGKTVILHYFPQSAAGFQSRRNFRLRPDDRKPSATVFLKDNVWFLQDKGGSDNRAYNAISLVMQQESLNFPQALEWIAAKFAPHLLEGRAAPAAAAPKISPAPASDCIKVHTRKGDRFTDFELSVLGFKISEEICSNFSLRPVDYYITRKNAKGKSYKVESTDNYPIYYYDYGTWGKLYQPLGDVRFMYVGQKPEGWMFGDIRFRKVFDKVVAGTLNTAPDEAEDEYSVDAQDDERLEHLIICSGPSDALNTAAAGYNVCWPNSESEDISPVTMRRLFRCCRNLYVMFDIDETGIANMYKLALQWLDLRIIRLPEELKQYKAKGKPCKDAKDFMMYFRKRGRSNPHKLFESLVTTSISLKWWIMYDKGKDGVSFDIDNEPLYGFLEANGFCRMSTPSDRKGYKFVRIDGNRVSEIPDDRIASDVRKFLKDYLLENSDYYSPVLVRCLARSKQISIPSLENLPLRELNFKCFSKDEEWMFFRNTAVRVTASGLELVPASQCPFHVMEAKMIDHDFRQEQPFFRISRSQEAIDMLANLESALAKFGPRSPEYIGQKRKYDKMAGIRRWRLELLRDDCTFMKYVYNTGRTHWRKEELGYPLDEAERAEQDLNFVNKVMAIGYLLCKYKDASKPYAVYCMEMEEGAEGEHNGGTGKSLFAQSIGEMRQETFVSGQEYDPSNPRFLLQEVRKDFTDIVFMDDLNTRVDLHRFMPMITGHMTVNPKYVAAFTIDFKESPKVVFTSNHAIRNFDASLRRRTFFCAFSDYYHADNSRQKLPERTPATEFGKQLIHDYTPEEMNAFYGFMLQCMVTYMYYRERVQPPMESIERRTLRNALGDDFIWWAEEYFNEDRLNCEVDRQEAFEAYKEALSDRAATMIKMRNFTDRLKLFCDYKGWEWTPEELLATQTEQDRGEIRRYVDGKHRYYFYISTNNKDKDDDSTQEDPDAPPFAP